MWDARWPWWVWEARERGPVLARLIGSLLDPLAALYTWRYRRLRARARPAEPRRPVVGVGSLLVGGAGKTVVARAIAEWLAGRVRVGVVVRPPGRVREEVFYPGGERPAYDEACEYWSAGFPVALARNRARGVELLADRADVIVVDDAFQQLWLRCTVQLVLWDVSRGIFRRCLPAGPLREPPDALKRADALLLTRWREGSPVEAFLERYFRGPVFRVPIETMNPPTEEYLLVLGVGNPEGILASLPKPPRDVLFFPDHYRYRPRDLQRIEVRRRALGVRLVATTSKDFCKWGEVPFPVHVLRARAHLPEAFWAWLKEKLGPWTSLS